MNKTSAILQLSTLVTGRRNSISQPAQSPVRCLPLKTITKISKHMRQTILFSIFSILVISTTSGQTSNWITLDKPQSGILGKLIQNSILTKDKVDSTFIQSEDGADQYRKEATRHFEINLKVTKFDKFKYTNISIDTMVIDYLKDAALFNNDNYLKNYFVYKALRAKSVTYYFKKTTTIIVDPKELLKDTIIKAITKQIPLFDSLDIKYTAKDTLAIKIFNPKVYFQAIAIQLKDDNCKSCRVSFGTALGETNQNFLMDLEDQEKSSATIYIPEGTKPSFNLYLDGDENDTSKLKLFVTLDEGFLKANGNFVSSPLQVPFRDVKIKGKTVRRFSFQPTERYVGSIISSTKRLLKGDVSLNIPVFLSVNGEQRTSTTVNFLNYNQGGLFLTKVEYPRFSFSLYKGKIQ